MLAMQYASRFPAGIEAAKARVNQRKPLFAKTAGLNQKFYLFDPKENIYAPIYIWRSHEAAHAFLLDPLFADVISTLGRPRVRTWMVLSYMRGPEPQDPVFACVETDKVPLGQDLAELAKQSVEEEASFRDKAGLFARLVGLDPDRWEISKFTFWTRKTDLPKAADCTSSFDVIGYAA